MRVISYNLREHKAHSEMLALATMHDADALCLQEAVTAQLPATLGHMSQVANTDGNRLGLAIYIDTDKFAVRESGAFALKKSLHDHVLSPAHERLLAVRLEDRVEGGEFLLGSFHAAPLSAMNSIRRHQIKSALESLQALSPGSPMMMVGDYNYPWFQRGLNRHAIQLGHLVSLSDKPTYRRRGFRGHFDFSMSKGLTIDNVMTLPQGLSDHLPIVVDACYPE